MSREAYGALARFYDALTYDVDYAAFADFYEGVFNECGAAVSSVLDFACGTGTLTRILYQRGYDVTGADKSEDMLSVAYDKLLDGGCAAPHLICQSMEELDLYGTVDAAICSLDGINYIKPAALPGVFSRVRLFLEPGGIFIFDVSTAEKLRSLDGEAQVDEADGVYCVWRTEFDRGRAECVHNIDIFARSGDIWRRFSEAHVQYAHTPEDIKGALDTAGFADIRTYPGPEGDTFNGRIFFSARKDIG